MKFFAALALALPVVSALSLNPDPATLLPVDGAAPARRAPAPQTNAQRMAHGLNPLAPHALRHKAASKTARAHYPRQSTTPPTSYSGILKAVGTDGTTVGFLGTSKNTFGEYEIVSDATAAAPLSFSASSSGGIFEVSDSAGSTSYPFLGGIVGFSNSDSSDDLKSGSFNYVYLGGVQSTPEGPAVSERNTFTDATGNQKGAESAIWTFDPSSSSLVPQWTNTDGSEPASHLLAITDNGQQFFVITGDVDTFKGTFDSQAIPITFVLVQA